VTPTVSAEAMVAQDSDAVELQRNSILHLFRDLGRIGAVDTLAEASDISC
jgi:hypothetical protein